MANCLNCGKRIPEGLDFCGKDCIENYEKRSLQPLNKLLFFIRSSIRVSEAIEEAET
ncbi:MAG: DUF2116 family Zn-ribbon domain-containing protein [Candidatus Bathyarchaeia archaeon]